MPLLNFLGRCFVLVMGVAAAIFTVMAGYLAGTAADSPLAMFGFMLLTLMMGVFAALCLYAVFRPRRFPRQEV